jgi:hypothetical protein
MFWGLPNTFVYQQPCGAVDKSQLRVRREKALVDCG